MKTIVVVDDEFGLVDVLATALSDVGYRVASATNGVRGLETMAEQPPDLVLLDFMMPLLDGGGVLEAMRADPKLAHVPVILMSSMSEATVREHAHGFVSFLRKPFEFDALLAAIDHAIGRGAG